MSTRGVYERCFDENSGKTINAKTCPECSGTLRTEGGETACVECGLIIDEYRIDHAATPTDFPDDETNTEQTGSPLSAVRHDRGLSTEIGARRDGRGNKLSWEKCRKFSRLRRYHSRARYRSKAERNLIDAFTEIARLVSALDLPFSVREQACTYFKEAQQEDLVQGRSIDSIAAASVYAACRCGSCTRTLPEVAAVTGYKIQKIRNAYQVLNVALGLEAKPPRPAEFVPRIASRCGVSDSVRHRARELTKQLEAMGRSTGSQPDSVAAACLYLAATDACESVTQREIADAANTTPQTIRTRCRKLQAKLDGANLHSA